EGEFVDRINGLTYEEIAERGGGILNSANKLGDESEDDLFLSAHQRLMQCVRWGTGAIEIKSGYGLSVESELKMLRVIKRLKSISPIPIKATFLGAHAMPIAYKNNRAEYIQIIIDEMLPVIANEELADYCDVFCDKGFYTPEETEIILKAALNYGLKPKIHANELGLTGGVQVGVANDAISVDHLEYTSEVELNILKDSNTIPTLLPSTAFFLGIPYPDARTMIEADLPICLASDYNPGSSPSGRMSFVMSLACLRMKMTPTEAFNACTINAAYALELQDLCGSITKGKLANLMITKPARDLAIIPYSFGEDMIDQIIIKGELISFHE
ncbi:MAG: imidazolonepropionase, partial [Bacteroidetes bacterium]|nr:imidazolonepropionase [Bacteroidota bacterium]